LQRQAIILRRGELMEYIHMVNFSGGKDSTALLLKMFEEKMRVDRVVMFDTGCEFPEAYRHMKKIEDYLGIKIVKLKPAQSFEYWLLEHTPKKGKYENHKDKTGNGWPNMMNRWCTGLKMDTITKYRKMIGKPIIGYHGIAADEAKRAQHSYKGELIRYPLIEWNMSEADCLKYCYDRGFDWEGFYTKFTRMSCWCCPLVTLKNSKALYTHYPDLWNKLKEWDSLAWNKFRIKESVLDLEKKFNNNDS
jgi:3'-phosphoadenosine 5'-phosphosulfate sulfotransferase (PAPS reductase)/FAD synthetase